MPPPLFFNAELGFDFEFVWPELFEDELDGGRGWNIKGGWIQRTIPLRRKIPNIVFHHPK